MEKIVASKFKLIKKIGAGSFGQIYIGEDIKDHKRFAIKIESTKNQSPQLPYESKLYNILSGCCSVPRLYFYGSEGHYNIMAIDLLGKSLEDHLMDKKHRLSLKTVLMLCDQMISCVEFVHNVNYIHRDIKPDNFVMGVGKNSNKIYIIDFGLSKRYRDPFTHQHIPWIDGKSLTGTARYASVNALRGIEQSRRDDMEALGYVWLYLLRGSLPWMGLKCRDQKHKYERICEVKAKTRVEDLCRGFPEEFVQYFREIKKLHFTDTPNYALYKQMFRSLFVRLGYVYDGVFDWTEQQRPSNPSPLANTANKGTVDVKNSLIITSAQPTGNVNQQQKQQNYNQQQQHSPRQQQKLPFQSMLPKDTIVTPKYENYANNQPETARRYGKREDERDGNQQMPKAFEQRKFVAQEPSPRQMLRAEPLKREAPNDQYNTMRSNKCLYGPPRVIKHTQLPRWMADVGHTVTRFKV